LTDGTGPAGSPSGDGLEALREEIRALDEELVRLVDRRRSLAIEIGRVKEELGLPVMDPSQEARVVRRAARIAREAGIDEEMVRDVVWRIIASARDAQEGRTHWGPPLPTDPSSAEDGGASGDEG
jgi:chorismate mutase